MMDLKVLSILIIVVANLVDVTQGYVEDNFLLFTNTKPGSTGRVIQMSIEEGTWSLVSQAYNPIAVAYSPQHQFVFFTDVVAKVIRRVRLDGSESMIIKMFSKTAIPDGLTIDNINDKLYYTDTGMKVIGRLNLDGSQHEILINNGTDQPRTIALNMQAGHMYWTDWGNFSRIERANLDGTQRQKLVDTGVRNWPNGLTLDIPNNHMYWCDGLSNEMWRSDLTGQNKQLIFHGFGEHFFGVAYFQKLLFYTAWNKAGVNLLFPGEKEDDRWMANSFAIHHRFDRLNDIIVYQSGNSPPACPAGYFGEGCRTKCNCKGGGSCKNGLCPGDCEPGWQGASCSIVCDSVHFGENCASVCHCSDPSGCDPVNGVCEISDCKPGYTGPNCSIECSSPYFGQSCSQQCHCINGSPCDHVTGACFLGACEPGWEGHKCSSHYCVDSAIAFMKAKDGYSSRCPEIMLITGQTLEECMIESCKSGGNAINYIYTTCSIRACEVPNDVLLSRDYGTWDVYYWNKPATPPLPAHLPSFVLPLVGVAGGVLLIILVSGIMWACCKKKAINQPPNPASQTVMVHTNQVADLILRYPNRPTPSLPPRESAASGIYEDVSSDPPAYESLRPVVNDDSKFGTYLHFGENPSGRN